MISGRKDWPIMDEDIVMGLVIICSNRKCKILQVVVVVLPRHIF